MFGFNPGGLDFSRFHMESWKVAYSSATGRQSDWMRFASNTLQGRVNSRR